ncbi:MFS transporter [Streptomyces sp. NBC_00259]|uniref:MFS transporter n=1 Tax=Streptomyces sp. NBC_00259 TaxID=2903643 RepID=UPI002E2C552E|nr:MFS transporter [Streptomyces sp. NBC_00259]
MGPRTAAGMRPYLPVAFLARLADEGMAVAVVTLALHRTGSAALGAYVLMAWMAPHVLAAPLAGSIAARASSPRLLYGAGLGCLGAAIAASAATVGTAPAPVTFAIALAGGCLGPLVTGALSGLIGLLTPPGPVRDRAYALDAAVYNAASVAGPGAAALLTGLYSPALAVLLLAAAALAAAALATALLPGTRSRGTHPGPGAGAGPQPHRAASTRRAALVAGPVVVWRVRELRAITGATCLAFLGIGGLTTTAVLLGGGGALMTAFAVGALAGSLAAARYRPRLPAPRLAEAALLGLGLALAAAAAVALVPSPGPWLLLPFFTVAGLCDGVVLTATLRVRSDHAPPGTRPQVFAVGAGLKISAAACGAGLAGLFAARPAPLLLLAIAALQLMSALLHVLLGASGRTGTLLGRPGRTGTDVGR